MAKVGLPQKMRKSRGWLFRNFCDGRL